MTNATFHSPTDDIPRTPESSLACEVPPVLFRPSNSAGRANDEVDLYWNGPIHHLFIPTLSPPRPSREEECADELSMESFASGAPHLSLKPRMSTMMPRVASEISLMEITSISPMPKNDEIPPSSVTKGLNESCTTFDSTWCQSEQGYRSPAASYEDDDDDASLAYSIDDEASELTSDVHSLWQQPSPLRPKLSKVLEMDPWDHEGMIPKQIVFPEDSWNPISSSFMPL